MGVVTAGMHHVHLLVVEFAFGLRGEGQAGLFLDRQGVHIRSQSHNRPRFAAFQGADNAGVSNLRLDFVKAQVTQVFRDECGSPELTVRQFRVGVNIAPPGDHPGLYGRY